MQLTREIIQGFLSGHDHNCVHSIQQFLEAFEPDSPLLEAVNSFVAGIVPRATQVVVDGVVYLKDHEITCPECGGEVWVARFCNKVFQDFPELRDMGIGGVMTCSNHPALAVYLDGTGKCGFDKELEAKVFSHPPRVEEAFDREKRPYSAKAGCGGCMKGGRRQWQRTSTQGRSSKVRYRPSGKRRTG